MPITVPSSVRNIDPSSFQKFPYLFPTFPLHSQSILGFYVLNMGMMSNSFVSFVELETVLLNCILFQCVCRCA
jgi:hypothetical protein